MRVEPPPFVFRTEDRRRRPERARHSQSERRGSSTNDRRARHPALPWLTPAFAAHLLGQVAPYDLPEPRMVARAYGQPESRTPPRPRTTETA